jgi:hypothetical protein
MNKRGSLKNVMVSADTVRPEEIFSSSLVDSSLPTLACDADTTTILDSIPSLDSSPFLVDTSTPLVPSSSENSTFFNTIGLNADDFTSSPLSPKQIQQLSQACVDSLTTNGCISMDLLRFIQGVANRRSLQHSTSTTPDDRPELLSCDKVPSFYPKTRRFSIPELHWYRGFCQLKD